MKCKISKWMVNAINILNGSEPQERPDSSINFYVAIKFNPIYYGLMGKREVSKKLVIDYGLDWVEVYDWGCDVNPVRCQKLGLLNAIHNDVYRELTLIAKGE